MPASFPLPEACVHLWMLPLVAGAEVVEAISACLSQEERDRAARLRHAHDNRNYTVARSALRWLIGRYLDVDPGGIRFEYGPHGKPSLAQGLARVDLRFNLSHTGNQALVAFYVGRAIGVDLELAGRALDAKALIRRFGAPAERAAIEALAPSEQRQRFLELWTCKEAWLKATGLGIAAGLERVEIDLATGTPRLVAAPAEWGGVHEWSLLLLQPADGLVAAVALHDPAREMREASEAEAIQVAPGLTAERIEVELALRRGAPAPPL